MVAPVEWRKVTIGGNIDQSALSSVIVSPWGIETASYIPISDGVRQVKLCRINPCQLGFDADPKISDFVSVASGVGCYPCSPEVPLVLRLDYRDQPLNERLCVLTNPVITPDGELRLFALRVVDGVPRLLLTCTPDCLRLSPETEYVLCIGN